MDKEFRVAYSKLNEAQKQAVDAIEGPVLVVAGPGTGKTQLLSTRVANILQKTDTDASSILCLTFTNKAAVNMRERLYGLIGPASRNVVVRTFHSFSAEIMNQYPDYFWNGARLSVAPDAVQDEIVQTILAGLPLKNPLASNFAGNFTALNDVKAALKLAKEAGLTPSELRGIIKLNLKYIDRIEPAVIDLLSPALSVKKLNTLAASVSKLPTQKLPKGSLLLPLSSTIKESLILAVEQDVPTGKTTLTGKWKQRWLQTVEDKKGMFTERKRNEWWLAVADVYETYRDRLHQRGYYDYSDMLIEVLEQLQKQPDMLADLQERYLYVLIDEFQDTNAAQLRLAHLVADHYSVNNRPNLMAVGDDDQSIFAFNGAELNNMLGFRRSYPDTKLIVLADNYRSSQAVLNTAKAIIELAEDRLVKREPDIIKKLVARHKPAGKSDIRHLAYPTVQHQHLAVAKRIKKLWKTGETDIAVLARQHSSLQSIASILLKEGVPVSYERRSNVLAHEAVRQACLVADVAVAISDGDRNHVNTGLAELLRHPMWQIKPETLWTLALDNFSQPDWLDSLLKNSNQGLQQIANWLVWLGRISRQQPLALVMEYILGLNEGEYLRSPFRDYYLAEHATSSQYLETLSAIELLRGLVQEFAAGDATLADFVRFVQLNVSTERVIADESWFMSGQQAVQLLTVHKAKGLEFEHVFLVDAVESLWRPRQGGRGSPANLQLQAYGEKYDDSVRLLYVAASRAKRSFIATSYFTDDHGNEILLTPLLAALPLQTINNPPTKPIAVLETGLRWPSLDSRDERALLQHRLDSFSLSPTALINFLNVAEAGPHSFKGRHLLRLPTARSAVGSFGIAIHAALETAQRLVNTSRLNIGTVLDRFEATLQAEHLAPVDLERYRTRGLELLPKLLQKGGLALHKGGLSEQRITDITLGETRINGELDRIDKTADGWLISDYKTGKPLTSWDTKDQSKVVKAWRHRTQMLFYALLVHKSARFRSTQPIRTQILYVEADKPSQVTLPYVPDAKELARLEQLVQAVWPHIMRLDFPDTSQYMTNTTGIQNFEQDLIDGKLKLPAKDG